MNPSRRDLMKWTDATSLWIVLTNDGSNFYTADRSALIKLRVSTADNTISLVEHLKFAVNFFPASAYVYRDPSGATQLVIGTAKKNLKHALFFINTQTLEIQSKLFWY